MKHLGSSLVLLGLIGGFVGENPAIANTPTQNLDSLTQKEYRVNDSSLQLAQSSLGQRGDCRAAKRETQLYAENNIRALTGIYLNENDIVQLLENSRGQRLISVFDPRRNISGYVETNELKLCSPTPPVVFVPVAPSNNPISSTGFYGANTPQRVIYSIAPSVLPQVQRPVQTFNTVPVQTFSNPPIQQVPLVLSGNRCTITTDTNLYESPGFNSNRGEFLETNMNIEVDRQRISTINNAQWIYASTPFGDSGWVVVNNIGCR